MLLPASFYLYNGLYRYVQAPKGMVFLPFWSYIVNRVLILAILVLNMVWLLHSSPELGMFLRGSYFFIIIYKAIKQKPYNLCKDQVHVLIYKVSNFGQVINRVAKITDFGQK